MRHLVEMVVDDLAKINQGVLLDLNLRLHVDLDARSVHNAKISDVVLAALADDHELRLPQLLVVGDLVVVVLTLSDLEYSTCAVDRDLEIFQLVGVHLLELHVELVGSGAVRDAVEGAPLHVDGLLKFSGRQLTHLNGSEVRRVHKVVKARGVGDGDTRGQLLDQIALGVERFRVSFHLILQRIVTVAGASVDHLLDEYADLLAVLRQAEDEVAGDGSLLVGGLVHLEELGDLVHVGELSKGAEEVIGRDGGLALEEGEPEDLRVLSLEIFANLAGQVVVHDVLEIDLVEVVGPGVQHGEALVLDALLTVLLDVLLDELEVRLIGVHGVAQVVVVDLLARVADKGANRLDARARLQVLRLDREVEVRGQLVVARGTDLTQNAHKHLLETLEVPVLVDASVDDARVEHLLRLHREQVAEVVESVDLLVVVSSLNEPVRE